MTKAIKFYYVYQITNNITSKRYIGSKVCYKDDPLNDGYWGSSSYLKDDINYFGLDNFKKEILCSNYKSMQDLINGESEYILKSDTLYPNGYNRTIPNRYPNFHTAGIKMSDETKKKISRKLKGKIPWMRGKKHTEEAIRKNRENHLGFIMSEDQKQKIANSLKNRVFSETHKNNLMGKGHPISAEQKKILSEFRKGKIPTNKGVSMTEEQKNKMREAWKRRKINCQND